MNLLREVLEALDLDNELQPGEFTTAQLTKLKPDVTERTIQTRLEQGVRAGAYTKRMAVIEGRRRCVYRRTGK